LHGATDKLQTGADWGDGRKQRREKMNIPDVFFTILLLLVHGGRRFWLSLPLYHQYHWFRLAENMLEEGRTVALK
jgi:hypothetical protein